jgi:hypothetical protein
VVAVEVVARMLVVVLLLPIEVWLVDQEAEINNLVEDLLQGVVQEILLQSLQL